MNSILNQSLNQNRIEKQATQDEEVIRMWLHGRSVNTLKAYTRDIRDFTHYTQMPLRSITLGDLQSFLESKSHLKMNSRKRIAASVKSLLSFAFRIGYTPFNVGAVLVTPPAEENLTERLLSVSDVHRMISLETNERNRLLLLILYITGGRVSSISKLKWKDLSERDSAGQISLIAKGNKRVSVLLPKTVWEAIIRSKTTDIPDAPLFKSQKGGHLDPSQIYVVVRNAAKRAGIAGNVSPHWLRHAHATHALENGCPIHLVSSTLGHRSIATTGKYLHANPNESSAKYLSI